MKSIEVYSRYLYRALNKVFNPQINGMCLYRKEFNRTKSIYIHIPKTGGTSVSHALYNRDMGHYKLKDYEKRNVEKFSEYYKFTVVRHPIARLESIYNYLIVREAIFSDPYHPFAFLSKYSSFEDFVIRGLDEDIVKNSYFFKTQTDYLKDNKGNVNLDYIAKLENIEADFKIISKKLNINTKLQKKNVSVRSKKKVELEHKVKLKIHEVYKEDFVNFNYTLD